MTDFDPDGVGPAQLFARFFHLEKLALAVRGGLGVDDFEAIAQRLSGLDGHELANLRAGFSSALDEAVDGLLGEGAVQKALTALPFTKGQVIVALGDSITDDALSWANQLELLLRRGRSDLELQVLNFGFTGDTTQAAITRFDTVLEANPDWVIQMLGTNDVRQHTALRIRTTSNHETARNLDILRRMSTELAGSRHIAMTPPPADEQRINGWEPFALESIAWESDDIRDVAALVAELEPHVDVYGAFVAADRDDLLLPDGLHPTLAGQSLIVRVLLDRLAALGESAHATTETTPHLAMTERSPQ